LHEVLDDWFARQVASRLVGRAVLVRYADDVVIIFGNEQDARCVVDVLPKRFTKYGLALHPEKTRLVDFRRPDRRALPLPDNGDARSRPDTFDLLGFTHYWAKSRKGSWVVKQRTAADRLRRALKRIASWCRRYRHEPVRDQWTALTRKLLGHFGYFGITGNYQALYNFWCRVIRAWRKWLSRRSQRAWLSQEKMNGCSWPDFSYEPSATSRVYRPRSNCARTKKPLRQMSTADKGCQEGYLERRDGFAPP
jgi:RNA-directed DNA polymerase